MHQLAQLSLAVTGSVLLGACAHMQPSPEFHAPSVSPVKHAVETAETHVSNARRVVSQLELDCPKSKAEIDWLSGELTQANAALMEASQKADELQQQVDAETKQANVVVAEKNKAIATIAPLEDSRHRWVKLFWYSAGLNAAAAVWIFKKPLLMLGAGAGI